MKKLLLSTAALLALGGVASAQVNVVPQTGLVTALLRQNTYGAISIGLVPAAAATDILCLQGSATKTVRMTKLLLSGSAGTAITTPFVLLRRVALDTAGTPATSTALPVAGSFDSSNPAATATLNAWTANPTINDGSPTYLMAAAVTLPVTASAGTTPTQLFSGTTNEEFDQNLTIRGAAQAICLNLNAATVTSGVLAISLEWTEQ